MASARPPQAQAQRTMWCGGCGAYLSVAPGARSVRCGLCHTVTRVERRRPHGLHHATVGFIKGLINAFTSPQPASGSPRAALQEQVPAARSASFPRVRGCKKRALLVGISYAATKYELRGAVNDVNCMSYLLRERFGFPADCILVLTRK
jgi:LSD1 subclass zinc finger protein